jgi:hypothetical protein
MLLVSANKHCSVCSYERFLLSSMFQAGKEGLVERAYWYSSPALSSFETQALIIKGVAFEFVCVSFRIVDRRDAEVEQSGAGESNYPGAFRDMRRFGLFADSHQQGPTMACSKMSS